MAVGSHGLADAEGDDTMAAGGTWLTDYMPEALYTSQKSQQHGGGISQPCTLERAT